MAIDSYIIKYNSIHFSNLLLEECASQGKGGEVRGKGTGVKHAKGRKVAIAHISRRYASCNMTCRV